MVCKKIPISLNDSDQRDINQMAVLFGYADTYGEVPKTLKFGITLTKSYILLLEKVIPDVSESELDILFSSIKKLRKSRIALEKAEKAQKEANKYNSTLL